VNVDKRALVGAITPVSLIQTFGNLLEQLPLPPIDTAQELSQFAMADFYAGEVRERRTFRYWSRSVFRVLLLDDASRGAAANAPTRAALKGYDNGR
jgi:hypothetical protein